MPIDDIYKHALQVAVDFHPDVLAAKASMVPDKECNSAQLEFFAAVAALDRAEQRVLANVESPPMDECTRVLAACGPFDVFGVPRDANEASALYLRASLLGSADAAYALGRLEPDTAAAREYFVVAARRGHRLAAAALHGEG